MNFKIQKATKDQAKARIALIGPSGSGKTYTALRLAQGLGKKIVVIDTEHGSASKYADEFEFHTLRLEDHFGPLTYVQAIEACERQGFDVVIVDSLSHAWMGKGGALEQVDAAAARSKGNSYVAWRDVTPKHQALIEKLLRVDAHLIGTMRAKTEYVLQQGAGGKSYPTKVGMGAIQRDGMEYEFDIVAELDLDHRMIVTKTRCRALDGAVIQEAGPEVGEQINDWLSTVPCAECGEAVNGLAAAAVRKRAGKVLCKSDYAAWWDKQQIQKAEKKEAEQANNEVVA